MDFPVLRSAFVTVRIKTIYMRAVYVEYIN